MRGSAAFRERRGPVARRSLPLARRSAPVALCAPSARLARAARGCQRQVWPRARGEASMVRNVFSSAREPVAGVLEHAPAPSSAAPPAVLAAAPTDTPHHIVVVGGGAGGLVLATKLGNRLGPRRQGP